MKRAIWCGGLLLEDDAAIRKDVAGRRMALQEDDVVPTFHLRGEKNALFKYSRRIIRAAAAEGGSAVSLALAGLLSFLGR